MRLILTLLTILFAWPTHAQMTLRNGALRNWSNCNSRLLNGLVSYWKLDETSGTRYDSMGTNNLTSNNSVGSATGVIGNASSLTSASSQYLSKSSATTLSMGNNVPFTISAWAKFTTLSANGACVVAKIQTGQLEYALDWNGTDRIRFYTYQSTAATIASANSLGTPATNIWYHIMAWYDGSSNNICINNGAVDSVACANGAQTSSANFYIGLRGNDEFMNGFVDETGIWKRVLTADERTTLYKQGLGTTYPSFSHRSRRIPESLYDTPANPLLAALYRKPEPISLDIP